MNDVVGLSAVSSLTLQFVNTTSTAAVTCTSHSIRFRTDWTYFCKQICSRYLFTFIFDYYFQFQLNPTA